MGQGTSSGGLAGRPTGPELCAELALLNPHSASDEQLLDLISAESRQLAYQQARLWAAESELGTRDPSANLPGSRWSPQQIFDSAAEELRAELLLTRRSAKRELEDAAAVSALPRVLDALAAGLIDRRRALVLTDGCWDLTAAQCDALLSELLPIAGRVTATELAEQVTRIAMALDPAWAEHRYRQAVRERKVVGYLNQDGTAVLSGQNLPADQAAMACARVDALADAAKRAGAAGKIDYLRAELFLGLLDGRFHGMTERAIIAELIRLFPKSGKQVKEPAAGGDADSAAKSSAASTPPADTNEPAAQRSTTPGASEPTEPTDDTGPDTLSAAEEPANLSVASRVLVPATTHEPLTRRGWFVTAVAAKGLTTIQLGEFTADPDPPPV